jgi:glycosyltransferase involved in cell wall biosynthesis
LLVPVKDAKALRDALRQLIEAPELRQRMGENGRLLAQQRFSIESVVSRVLAIYADTGR